MTIIKNALLLGVCCACSSFAIVAAADDRAVSAVVGCEVSLGDAVESANGMKASGGTAVLKCPLSKKVGTSTAGTVYARIHRVESSGASPFCYLVSTPPYGSASSVSYGYASSSVGAQSISVPMPSLYLTGYLDLYCLLNKNDTFYGARHVQVD